MKKVEKYPKTMRILHWLMAAVIFSQIILGFLMEDLGKNVILIHAGVGFSILFLTLLRLVVLIRMKNALPPKPTEFSDREWKIAKFGHSLIYILLISVPASGALAFFSGNHDLGEFHETMVWVFILLLAGHILITIKHQFLDKRTLLQRMT